MHIFKYSFLVICTILYGQHIVEQYNIPIEKKDSLMVLLNQEIFDQGYFGGGMKLIGIDKQQMQYEFFHEPQDIHKISFTEAVVINDRTLAKIFDPLKEMISRNEVYNYIDRLYLKHRFIPKAVEVKFGIVDEKKIGALINFDPQFNSHLSGVIGAGQQNNMTWQLAGEVDVRLENTFQTANISELVWKRQNSESQFLHVIHEEPYPFGLPFGIKVEFIQDFWVESYVLNKFNGAFSIHLNSRGKWYFGGSKERLSPTSRGDSLGIEPYHVETFIVNYIGDFRDDLWLPTVGSLIHGKTEIGEFGPGDLIYRLDLKYEQLIPLSGGTSLQTVLWSRGIWSTLDSIHVGQKFKYGGRNSIRGFNEDIFIADAVAILNINLLVYPIKNLQLYSFSDMAVDAEKVFNYSIGLGLKQRNQNSVMEISFAWPNSESFSMGKVHVKFTALLD